MLQDIHCVCVLCIFGFHGFYHAAIIPTECVLQQTIQILLKVFLK